MVKSLMGIPPIDGHIRVADNDEGEELDCRSSTDFTTASCSVIDRMAVGTTTEEGGHNMNCRARQQDWNYR